MASKVSFRSRPLDPHKPLSVYHAVELSDLSEYAAINRNVPIMPTGMEKEEEMVSGGHIYRLSTAGARGHESSNDGRGSYYR